MEQLGNPVIEGLRLAKVEKLTLRKGRRRNFANKGDVFRWIKSDADLRNAFLSHITSSDASSVDDLADAGVAVFDSLDAHDYNPAEVSDTAPKLILGVQPRRI